MKAAAVIQTSKLRMPTCLSVFKDFHRGCVRRAKFPAPWRQPAAAGATQFIDRMAEQAADLQYIVMMAPATTGQARAVRMARLRPTDDGPLTQRVMLPENYARLAVMCAKLGSARAAASPSRLSRRGGVRGCGIAVPTCAIPSPKMRGDTERLTRRNADAKNVADRRRDHHVARRTDVGIVPGLCTTTTAGQIWH